MLESLHIENLAVIKSVDLDFTSGFSALTGETGTGKSVIIDSIGLLLGKKAEKDLIRHGENTAMVSGLFGDLTEHCAQLLSEYGVFPDEDGRILIQRSVSLDGRSQIRINGRAANLSVLKAVSGILVNIHGQSDTHALTSVDSHISILDMYADNIELLKEYRALYNEHERIKAEIKSISDGERERLRYVEMLRYQIADIDALELVDGEEEELIDKKIKIKNSERITKQAGFVFKALKGSEKGSVSFLLDRSITALKSLSDVLPDFESYSEKLRDCLYQVDDIAEEVYEAFEDLEADPTEKLNAIESRLDKISKIKRKYGYTVAEVLKFRDSAAAELEKYDNADELLKEYSVKLEAVYQKAVALASKLHEARVKAAKSIERSVCDTLSFLDMPKVIFTTAIKEAFVGECKSLNKNGTDSVEFLISANRGLDPQPIARIASGGELARIMLALKSVIADKDGVMTIIFDEIDAGVSGKTARKIGIKMCELANTTQLICVTHSAQIASLADTHFLISKSDVNGKTETTVAPLDGEGRIAEVSRILGGISVTDAQRAAAIDMLKERETYKL